MKQKTTITISRHELLGIIRAHINLSQKTVAIIPNDATISVETGECYNATVEDHNPLEISWES